MNLGVNPEVGQQAPLPPDAAEEVYKRLGQMIKAERVRAGVTQEELAERVGLTRTSITNIEGGRQKIQLHTLYSIAGVLNVMPERLLPPAPSAAPRRLVCFVCGFDLQVAYGAKVKDRPGLFYLRRMPKKRDSGGSETAVLCANCELRTESEPLLTLEQLRRRVARRG